MKIRKQVLDAMERCYAAGSLEVDGRLYAVLASEAIDGPCYAYTGDDFNEKEVIWENAGGTMSLLQIPGTNGEFIAVQRFFPGFKSEDAKLVWGKRDALGGWIVKDLAPLPFIHRFDLFSVGDDVYILAATLCGSKKEREDWSDPGKVYAGRLPSAPEAGVDFVPILENLYKNHGYCRGNYHSREAGFVTCEGGVYVIQPPLEKGGKWETRLLLDCPVSDAALCDLDGDGADELVTIEPFHGDHFLVRKKIGEHYETVYSHNKGVLFAHAVAGCTLRGKPSVVCGMRRGDGDIFILRRGGAGEEWCCTVVVEHGAGTSNVAVVNQPDRDIIISANHSRNEAALYFITD